jgi:two-component system cell cycle response regulator DivK
MIAPTPDPSRTPVPERMPRLPRAASGIAGGAASHSGSSNPPGTRSRRPPPIDRRRQRPAVLLVDDLEDQRELYRQYLEFAGYDVTVARDGYEAIDRALGTRPDVVIMDLSMPGLDGFEATQRLKLLDSTRGIPVIALTAHGTLPREWALNAGCAAYLRKPCYPHDLALEIASVLERPRLPAPEPVCASPAPPHPHVLVVDASVGDRELFAEYLEYRGCEVSVAVDPAAALRDARRLKPSVIVLDLDMGRPDGGEMLRQVRQDPGTRETPVVALSRKGFGPAAEEARSLGAVLLIKPCEPEALYLEVCRAAAGGGPQSR